MPRRRLLLGVCLAALCGCPRSSVPPVSTDASVDAEADADARVGQRPDGDAAGDVGIYVDPGCDAGMVAPWDAGEPTCDPLDPDACGPGLACRPTVSYPSGPCGEEVFTAFCSTAGAGGQGAPCFSTADCAPGHVCFVTGETDQCLQLCDLHGGAPRCPRGRVCVGTDLSDYGACA